MYSGCCFGRGLWLLLLSALLSLALWPAPEVLVDYPNHIARAHILAHPDRPALAAHYGLDRQLLIPYLGLDAITVPLAALLGPQWAGRLGLTLMFMALTGATLLLDRVLNGRVRWTSALMLPALFNALLAWGNVNYLLGVAGLLAVFAGWIASEPWPAWRRLLVFAAASTLLFLCHVIAAAVWAMLVAAYELGRLLRLRRWDGMLPGALQFLPAAALWLAVPHSMHVFEVSTTRWGSLLEHLLALASPFTFDVWLGRFGSPTALVDWLTTAMVFGGLAAAALSRRLSIDPRLWAPLLLGLAFTLAVPVFVQGIWANHLRLPTVMVCLLAAGLQVTPPLPRLAAVAVLALLLLRLATLGPQMAACGATVDELRRAFALLPAGARLLPVLDRSDDRPMCRPWQSFSHIATTAISSRDLFVPTVFWENTLLDLRHPEWMSTGDLRTPSPGPFRQPRPGDFWADWRRDFDAVLWLHLAAAPAPLPTGLAPLYQGEGFTLYRVEP